MGNLCKLAKKNNIAVLLGGDCVDEFFAGYNEQTNDFVNFRKTGNYQNSILEINKMSPYFSENITQYYQNYLETERNTIYQHLVAIEDKFERFAQAHLIEDTAIFLQICNLPHSDAYSMMESVELRNPMLDIDLVKWVVNLPIKKKFNISSRDGMPNKFLLRQLANKLIGNFMNVSKEGTRNFSKAISIEELWNLNQFRIFEVLGRKKIHSYKDLFKIINLEIFHRTFFESNENFISEIYLGKI